MKKNGFTLAEVLITLAIIGVVATMTLPTLMNNAGEQQYKTGFKKGINILTEAGQMNEAIAGYDYSSITDDNDGSGTVVDEAGEESETDPLDQKMHQSMYALLANRTSIDRSRTGNGGGLDQSMPASNSTDPTDKFTVFFRDGSALMYNLADTNADDTAQMQGDGLPKGFPAIFDVNGTKGPNLISNCQGNGKLGDDDGQTTADPTTGETIASFDEIGENGLEAQCNRAGRVIKDRFYIQLRGSRAVPVGAAATWAFEN